MSDEGKEALLDAQRKEVEVIVQKLMKEAKKGGDTSEGSWSAWVNRAGVWAIEVEPVGDWILAGARELVALPEAVGDLYTVSQV